MATTGSPAASHPYRRLWLDLAGRQGPIISPTYDSKVDPVGVLARTALFQGFPAAELEALAPALKVRTFAKGSYVFHQGDPAAALFVVQSGQVKISRMGRTGEEAVYAVLVPGDILGELALFETSSVRTADAQAVERTECVTLGRDPFLRFLEEHPALIRILIRTIARYLDLVDDAFAAAAFVDIPARVARKLLELGETHGRKTPAGVRIDMRLSQRVLAGMVAASRENVNRALRRFEAHGDIVQEAGTITIVHPAELRKRS